MRARLLCAVLLFGWSGIPSVMLGQETLTARPPWTSSRVHGSPEPPAPYRIEPAFPKLRFELPTSLEEVPGTNRLLVTERAGRVSTFAKDAGTGQADLALDLRELLPSDLAGQTISLFDAELHPSFGDNRYLFVCYVHPGIGGHSRVSRFTLTNESVPRAVPGSEQVLITWPSGGHNAGCLEFGKDGYLYIATGDGSGPNPPDARTTGQDISDLLGSILRIDVDHPGKELPYSIPQDNPFVATPGARPEVWAYGLRNPWKFGIDPQTGEIFAADNGWESWEMVHRIVRGGNCGWPTMEGRASLRAEVAVGPTPILPPVKDHPHTEANSVIGGPVYRGAKLPGLGGSFVYGDYITGTIWAIHPDKDGAYSHQTLVDTDQRIVAFLQARGGELYVLDYDLTGQIYELLPANVPDTSASFPRRLSQTGLFASLTTMEPAAGVMPYSVVVEPWMDGAAAHRFVAVPQRERIELAVDATKPSQYPEGTVLVKHVTLPQSGREPIRLETQLLHYERGVWNPYSYLWDDAGRDAELVDSIGTNRPLKVEDPAARGATLDRTWHVNATNECKLCHNAGPRFVLGFVPNQLDHAIQGSSQLKRLAAQGVIDEASPLPSDNPSRLVHPHDPTHAIDDRARSYLHANCSMCHHPGGTAIASFFLRRDLPFDKLNTNKGTGIGTFGIQNAKVIAAGDPYRSLLLYRMSKLGFARMPYIGSQVVDSSGVTLIEAWIRSLPLDPASAASQPLSSNSAEAKALTEVTTPSTSAEHRDEAIKTLAKSTEASLLLVSKLHHASTASEVRQSTAKLAAANSSSNVRGLFETFLPESQRRVTLGATIDPQAVLSRPGDRERGKLIFFSDGARCRNCHQIDDPAQSLGPTLQEINKKYAQLPDLLQQVLEPSRKIDGPYAGYAVLTSDGRSLSGLIVEQNDREVVIKTTERKLERIPRDSLAAMQKSPQSLMPDRILSDLTAQEAADLFAYIQSLSAR